jgi:hypothetical protein
MGKKKVFIYRRNWRTGGDTAGGTAGGIGCHGSGPTKLQNWCGYHCCLGFIIAQTHPELVIQDIGIPESCNVDIKGLTDNVTGRPLNTELTWAAIELNDNPSISLTDREQRLRELFEDSPYELEFVGEYNEPADSITIQE